MASIREVAKLAGVSPSTVSRVINGTANVDADKKERVLKAIDESGFTPNEVARSLFKKSSKTIGVIIPSITNPFFTEMSSAVEHTADRYGYRMTLCNTDGSLEKEKNAISMLTAMNVDGIIITTSNHELKKVLEHCETPIVTIDRAIARNNAGGYIHCDNFEGGRLAAEHLSDCGCRSIVCVRGIQQVSSARERFEGYLEVCRERKLQEQSVECDYEFHQGPQMVEELLQKYPDVDGIIACNDMVAISIYKMLSRRGIRVPEDIQLIGYDNIFLSGLMTPEFTTIEQPIEKMGVRAVEMLIRREADTGYQEYIFSPKLIVRDTTIKKKGDDQK